MTCSATYERHRKALRRNARHFFLSEISQVFHQTNRKTSFNRLSTFVFLGIDEREDAQSFRSIVNFLPVPFLSIRNSWQHRYSHSASLQTPSGLNEKKNFVQTSISFCCCLIITHGFGYRLFSSFIGHRGRINKQSRGPELRDLRCWLVIYRTWHPEVSLNLLMFAFQKPRCTFTGTHNRKRNKN